ncbi:MAG: extracellular solute-binding protein [Acidisphaera sp.]|nr:extracellular solute-binding protein [Acidisphaera sp.]
MNTISRRQVSASLGLLAASSMFPRAAAADMAALEAAARKEGTLTWYIAQVDGATAELMGRAFTKRYPGISVQVIRTTGQVAYERLEQDLKNRSPQCDVFSSTDISHYPALIKRNALAHFTPENAAAIAPAFDGLGEPGLFYPTTSTVWLMGYSTKRVKPEDAPKSWPDLLDPKWKNQVATGHPAFSGYVGIWALAMRKMYGWEYFEKLAKNNPLIGRSGLDPITNLNGGERTVCCAPLFGLLTSADKGNPIAPQYPADGSVLCIGPAAVMADAPHPNAGRLFMEWLLSREFAELCVENRTDPVRADVAPKAGEKPLSEVKLLRLTTAEIGKGVPEVIEQWRDTFGS